MKNLLLIYLVFIGCNQNSRKEESNLSQDLNIEQKEKYPPVIDSLGIQKLFDEAKWNLYCIYSDDTVKFKKKVGVNEFITYGSLDLKFENVEQRKDTTEIHFNFYWDTLKCDILSVHYDNRRVADGVVFRGDSVLYYTSPTTMRYFWENDTNSRYTIPLQPNVIYYIRSNEKKLNPWFLEEAKRRGVVQ